jgi:DUF1680 family protein
VDVPLTPGSYVEVRRNWRPGDLLRLQLPLQARWMESHPYVRGNLGRLALQRGPLVYCFESVDNPGFDLRTASILPEQPVLEEFRPELLGGVTALQVEANLKANESLERGDLYRLFRPDRRLNHTEQAGASLRLTAVPYYAWANREPGQLQVWMAQGQQG